jgi:hypothetical protein
MTNPVETTSGRLQFGAAVATKAESVSDRFARFCSIQPHAKPPNDVFVKKIFGASKAQNERDRQRKNRTATTTKALSHNTERRFMTLHKALFHRRFCNFDFCARDFIFKIDLRFALSDRARDDALRRAEFLRARTPFVKWSRGFLHCAVVIAVQCCRFAMARTC